MNEEQRKASSVRMFSPEEIRKQKKIIEKYFEHVYQPPNLKEAKKRGKQEVRYNRDFQIDEQIAVWNERTFLIKTYGCQMNAHDTEVIAGILEALGYQATTDINTEECHFN